MSQPEKHLIIRQERDGPTSSFAQVKIAEDGNFVFEGAELGPDVEKFFGDSDFEYWLRIRADQKDLILLHLVKERFTSVQAFKEWLAERQIPSEFTSF